MIEHSNPELSLLAQADLLSLNRSSLYYMPAPATPDELYLKRRIDEIFTKYPFYGSRKIQAVLRQERPINRKAVQRHMHEMHMHFVQEMGLAAIYPGPNLSKRASEHHVFPYLLRHLTVTAPNHVWGIDITYVRLRGGWLYLVAVLDWYSRYVISGELDQTLEMPFVLSAVQSALQIAVPRIWNSDHAVPAA